MQAHTVYQFLERKPFVPFTLSLTDRSSVWIDNPKRATLTDSGEALRVTADDGRQIMIAVLHIVSITVEPIQDEPVVVKHR